MEELKVKDMLTEREKIREASIADGSFFNPEPNYCGVARKRVKVRRSAKAMLAVMMVVFAMILYFMWTHFIVPWFTSSAGQMPTKHTTDGLLDFDDVCYPFQFGRAID